MKTDHLQLASELKLITFITLMLLIQIKLSEYYLSITYLNLYTINKFSRSI